MRAPPVAVRTAAPRQSRATPGLGVSGTAMFPLRTGSNQSNLELLKQSKKPQATPVAANDPSATARKPVAKLPPLSPEMRAEMIADVDDIVRILKKGPPELSDQLKLLETVRKWSRKEFELSAQERGSHRSPVLDQFLIHLKGKPFKRVKFQNSVVSWFEIEQHAMVYDALWHELSGFCLEEFKRVVRQSETERTDGAENKDFESVGAVIAKQEAMGMWGMLKGMGTGLVSMAGPSAAQYISEQFDQTGNILFGQEWGSSEALVAGMNAAQIGTAGGDVIMQLVMFARSLPNQVAKGGKVLQLINNLDKFKRAHQILGALGGAQGMLMAVKGIAEVIDAEHQAGRKVTANSLIHNAAFVDQIVMLASSGLGMALAIKGAPPPGPQAVTRARIGVLLGSVQVTAALNDLADIAQSDASDAEKQLRYGVVLAGLIPQLVSLIIAGHGHVQAKREAAQERQAQKLGAEARSQEQAMAPPVKEPPPQVELPLPEAQPEASPGKTMSAAGESAAPQKKPGAHEALEQSRKPIADTHQAQMQDEVKNRLGPRDAPAMPDDLAAGLREPHYTPPARGEKSKTIGQPHPTLEAARQAYDHVLAETGGHYEAGIWQHPDTGEYIVQLGHPTSVDPPDRDTSWRSVQHFHPNTTDVPLWRMPSSADVSGLVSQVMRQGSTVTEMVEYPLPNGSRGRAAYTVTSKGQLIVEFIGAEGQRVTKTFNKVEDYKDYHPVRKVAADPSIQADVDAWLEARRNNQPDGAPEQGGQSMHAAAPQKPAADPDLGRQGALGRDEQAVPVKSPTPKLETMADAKAKAAKEREAATALWDSGTKTGQGEESAKVWKDKRPAADELAMLSKELGATGPITSDKLLQLYRHGSRATVVKYLKEHLKKQAAAPEGKGVLTVGDMSMKINPRVALDKQIDAFVKSLEGAHFTPQSISKKLPKDIQDALPGAKANPDDALVLFTEKGTHTAMDQPWKDAFDRIRKSGAKQTTGKTIFDEIADGIHKTPGMSDSEKASRVARLKDEMLELGLVPDRKYDVPQIYEWWKKLASKVKGASGSP